MIMARRSLSSYVDQQELFWDLVEINIITHEDEMHDS